METNLNIQDNKETFEILKDFPLKGIYYQGEYGIIDTRFKKESKIYIDALNDILFKMIEHKQSFDQAVFHSTRFEILEDYSQGFLNQQQLSDYLKDSYMDETMAGGNPINDVYIR
ncbi:hypothetical protein [Floccifex sp.]|uniref:hypothetical protein n=1 Tax=Floccifex sp. TaxID=2815810 RepID=UPI003F07CC35